MTQRDKKKGFDLKRHRAEWDRGFAAATRKTGGDAPPRPSAAAPPEQPERTEDQGVEPTLARSGDQDAHRRKEAEKAAAEPPEPAVASSDNWGKLSANAAYLEEPEVEPEAPREPYLSMPERQGEDAERAAMETAQAAPRAPLSADGLAGVTARTSTLAESGRRGPPRAGDQDDSPGELAEAHLTVPPSALARTASVPRGHPVLSGLAVLVVVAGVATALTLQGDADPSLDDEVKTGAAEESPEAPHSEEGFPEAPAAEETAPPVERAALAPGREEQPAAAPPEDGGERAADAMPLPSARPETLEEPGRDRGAAEAEAPAAHSPESEEAGVPTPARVADLIDRRSGEAASSRGAEAATDGANNLIAKVQRELLWRGFDPGPVDGRFGDRTSAAIRAFQREIGVQADGQVNPEVLRQLRLTETAPASPSASEAPASGSRPGETQVATTTPVESPADGESAASTSGKTRGAGSSGRENIASGHQAESATVLAVQRALRRRGFEPGSVDGIEGPQTRAAIRSYQIREGVVVDGKVDPALLDSLQNSSIEVSRDENGGIEDRFKGAVDAVAEFLGLKVEGDVDPNFATPNGKHGR